MKPTNPKRTRVSATYLVWLLVLLVSLLAAWPAAAQSGTDGQAVLRAPDGRLTVGDPIVLTLSVTHPVDQHVIAPELESNWGDFIIQDISTPQVTDNGDGSETTDLAIDARLFAPGTFTSPPLTVKLVDGTGQVVELVASPLTVEISSVLLEGDSELRDIKPQVALPYVNLLPWVIVGIFLFVVAAVTILLVRRRRAQHALAAIDNRLPHAVALDELTRIESLHLPETANFKEHYSLISDCMRKYMEQTIRVPMLERTTAEIGANLRETSLPRPVARQYLSLLDESDLVKFSKFSPQAADAYGALELARQLVLATKRDDVSDASSGGGRGQVAAVEQVVGAALSSNGTYQQTEVGA